MRKPPAGLVCFRVPRGPLSAAVALLLVLGVALVACHRSAQPPVVPTTGLDPAVAKLIESTLREARAAPRSGEAWGKLGTVLMHHEFIEEASVAFDQAAAFSPRDPRWPYLQALLVIAREPAAALPKLRRAAELCGDRPDMPRLQLAQLLAERGAAREAEQHFRALLRLVPDHPPALLGLARLRLAEGRLEESRKHLDRCLDDPHTAKAASALLAQVLQALGDGSAAEAAGRRSARLPPDAPWPDPYWAEASAYHVGRKTLVQDASVLLDQGRLAEAIQVLAGVTRDYPEDDEAWYLIGWAYNRAQRSAEAERALREHLRRTPQSAKGLSQLAVALLGQKRPAEAVEVLKAALQLKPTWRELHYNLGYASVQLGRADEAIAHLRAALAHDPNHAATYTALAELLSRAGEREEARRLLRQALAIDPSDARAQALLRGVDPGG